MKKLMVLLVVLVSGLGYSQENPAKMLEKNPKSYKFKPEDFRNLNSFYEKGVNRDSVVIEVFKIFNEYRRYVGVHELVYDTTLQKVADIQSKYCLSIGESTHIQENNPSMKTPPMRLKSVDPKGRIKFVGEISSRDNYKSTITRNRTISQNILDLFYFSTSHKKIIESTEATKIGISIHIDGSEIFTVAVFGK
jgi:uncharacterized protein YkwD